jgi:hypothetical protein
MTQTEREDGLRELDAWIAEYVMGWKWATLNPETYRELTGKRSLVEPDFEDDKYYVCCSKDLPRASYWYKDFPYYSTDLSAAHQMETRIKELGLELEYAVALAEIVGRKAGLAAQYNEFDLLHASASERCRAARMVIEQVSRPGL